MAFVLFNQGCEGATPNDAGLDGAFDAALDAGPPQRETGPPPPVPRPPRPREPDAGCPPPPDPGAAWMLDLPLAPLEVGDIVRAADGGSWVVASAGTPRQLWWLRFDADGAPRFARTVPLEVLGSPRAATVPEGGLLIASPLDDALLVLRIDSEGHVLWAHTRSVPDGRFRGPAPIAADADGIVVAGSVALRSTRTEAVEVAWLTLDGETTAERRLRGARSFAAVDALGLSAEQAVLSIRTDGFSSRTHLSGGVQVPVVTPWIMALNRDGTSLWDESFDLPEGDDLHLDTIVRSSGGWSLGGSTEGSGGQPWVVEMSAAGLVRTVTQLPNLRNLSVLDLARDDTGLRMMQVSPNQLFVGPAHAESESIVQLDMVRGTARLMPSGGLYAGPPPECTASLVPRNHPALCGSTRRSLMLLPLPHDRVSACMRALFTEPFADQGRERPFTVPLPTGRLPEPFEADVEALSLTDMDVAFQAQRLCISSPDCIRAFAVP